MKLVEDVFTRHDSDGDGGYAAVADLRAKLVEASAEERRPVIEHLTEVAMNDRAWRGVALETLVQEGAVEAGPTLYSGLDAVHDEVWKRELVRGLLRLGHRDRMGELQRYVTDRLVHLDGGDLTLIAVLANVDPASSVEIAAEFWSCMHAAGKGNALVAYLPSLLINYAKIRPALIRDLLYVVQQKRPSLLKGLLDAVATYLEKPWTRNQLGIEAWEQMRKDVAEFERSVN